MNREAGKPTPPECALAAEMFDHFCSAISMKQILSLHREMCTTLNLKPNRLPDFYPKLKSKLASSWKAQALFKKFDARANHKVYAKGRACVQSKVLIIGAGPCGLRAAIECQLLGAKVVVVEKRDRMTRNNVLHLWPFVIQDLRALGAKKFYGKFCAGSIDHISIRQLQFILLKVALLLGVEVHEGVDFVELLEPTTTETTEVLGWRPRVTPHRHPVSQYEFDVLIGADGKRNTVKAFKRAEFRGKLALAITANFINRHTEQEASVPEISGVAFIFNQKFFKNLYQKTGIDLENIVYYKDGTHYFVMTAKKHSLLDKGVLLNDYAEISRLLSVENVDRAALMRYAQEAARFSTDGKLPLKDFALNHYGEPDVALFDFTSMYASENASMVYERHGRRLLCQLVGDSLLEPFWPTGSGCARGFLSALDAAWAVRSWEQSPAPHPLEVIAERESIYRLLAQTTPENLHKDFNTYTLDPGTRYPNLNRVAVTPLKVTSFYDSDDPLPLGATPPARKRRREGEASEETLVAWVGWTEPGIRAAVNPFALTQVVRRYRPDLLPAKSSARYVYHLLRNEFGIMPVSTSGFLDEVPEDKLRSYLNRVYNVFKGEVPHIEHETNVFIQIKKKQKEKRARNAADDSVSVYSNAADAEKSQSYRKKRRAVRTPQVSNDPAEYIRKKIGKLELNDITKLARLIEGHDAIKDDDQHDTTQKELQEEIIALLDPEDAPDPKMIRDSIAQLLQGTTKTIVRPKEIQDRSLGHFFQENQTERKPVKPPRKLKGLDAGSIKVPDFSDIFDDSADTDATVIKMEPKMDSQKEKSKSQELPRQFNTAKSSKKKEFIRSASTDSPLPPKDRKISEMIDGQTKSHSPSPDIIIQKGRSNSIGAPEMIHNTKRIAQIFEGHKRRHTPSPESRSVRSGSISNPEMVLRLQRMAEIIEGKRRDTPSPDRSKRSESIGNPEMALRRQRVAELIQGYKPRSSMSPEPVPLRKNSGEMAFRVQRASDMMQKKSEKRPRTGRRKAAREIMKQRFEKSIQMLATEPRLEFAPSADLENDYGLQQYRASAPQFGERVKKLEKKLQHYEEGRVVGAGARSAGGGARVAQLAAELAGTTNNNSTQARASKPKDLMRSVGRIERDDWNVREIERKIMENRLGRPEPKTAERVPKWDREQFLGRQRRLREGDGNEERWVEIDETLNKLDQKLRDSGRPDHGTKKVANLATKFTKKAEPQMAKDQAKEKVRKKESKKNWRSQVSSGVKCAVCALRVFAAEGVIADGVHVHRACFNCFVCKTPLRPGNYSTEIFGGRLFCLRHGGVTTPDAVAVVAPQAPRVQSLTVTPERISLELSDSGGREIDEEEWTDRNFLLSETSGAILDISDDEESLSDEYTDATDSDKAARVPEPAELAEPRPHHSDLYFSEDSFGYDDYSEDGAESSGNESCSRMRAAREARRREVPVDQRLPTDSSEVESEDESESSDDEVSSATQVSTDSEFAREECVPVPSPPAIIVTEIIPPAPPPPPDYPLSRTRSAGGLATKRALELKRKYLLGEPSPPAVRKSDSTSQLDTKLETFRTNITEFQKMLHPAPTHNIQPQRPIVVFQLSTEEKKVQPMPDIIKKICDDAPVDLLTKVDSPLCKKEWREETPKEEKKDPDLDSDSLSEDDSSHIETAPNQSVPRVEVHDEGGELIQLDSLTIINSNSTEDHDEKESGTGTGTGPTVVAVESESSESCRDATTLALTETELSDWAAESPVLDDCGFEDKDDKRQSKNPRTLSGPKTVHDAKNISALSSHVCGRMSPEPVVYSNALEHFEFADEGDQDPSIETPVTPRNDGYMELVDDFDHYSPSNDRSINFEERSFSEMVIKPTINDDDNDDKPNFETSVMEETSVERKEEQVKTELESNYPLNSPQILLSMLKVGSDQSSSQSSSDSTPKSDTLIQDNVKHDSNGTEPKESTNSDISPPLEFSKIEEKIELQKSIKINKIKNLEVIKLEDSLSHLALETQKHRNHVLPVLSTPLSFPNPCTFRLYSPAICRSASENFQRPNSRSTTSSRSIELPPSILSSGSASPISPSPLQDTTNKVQEIKREREEQTEVVRRLVLERLGSGPRVNRRSTKRTRMSPASNIPPPVPPPPVIKTPPPLDIYTPPPRPAPPLMPLPVTPSFSDPELARERRSKSIMKSISNYLNRRLGPRHKWASEPDLTPHPSQAYLSNTHKSTGALLQEAPPVPPPPACYCPPSEPSQTSTRLAGPSGTSDAERDAMQLWFEARWAKLVPKGDPVEQQATVPITHRYIARLERRLSKPVSE